MFSVIISEKGGAERRETFDRTEINVGRVQGNDLMLPKGNVSKRHARLLFRDGRFIVTDLKSTNGTYVNGRKIAQATIVREGDKIYIGDFVLRIEDTQGGSAPPQPSSRPSGEEAPVAAPPQEGAPEVEHPSSPDKQIPRPQAPRIEAKSASSDPSRPPDVVSHFPLEHDPDESVPYQVPAPPRVPSAAVPRPAAVAPKPMEAASRGATAPAPPPQVDRPSSPSAPPPHMLDVKAPTPGSGPAPAAGLDAKSAAAIAHAPMPGATSPAPAPAPMNASMPSPATPAAATPIAAQNAIPRPEASPRPTAQPPSPAIMSPVPPSPVATPRRAMPPAEGRADSRPPSLVTARRSALATLVERVAESVDLSALASGADETLVARIDAALLDRSATMRANNELPSEIDPEALLVDARREILELGPLTALFEDEDVTEIHVMRHDYVLAVQGKKQAPIDVVFTSETAVDRVLRRLCRASGRPLAQGERFVERVLPRGARLFAVVPHGPDQGHMIVIRKPQRADLSLEDLVRSGTISRAMAGLFSQCVAARANILVTGQIGAGATSLLGALAAAGSTEDRVVVLQEDDEIVFNQPHTISIVLGDTPAENAKAVQAAARARPDRLVVGAFAGAVAVEVVDAMGDGADGVLAAARAPTLRQALARLTADIAATRAGIALETAREWLASSFDLAVEIGKLRDGRHRVLRVAELAMEGGAIVAKDVFTFGVERTAAGGAVEGSFHATGLVPALIDDLAARGIQFDVSVFKRH